MAYKYKICLSLNTSWALIFYIDAHVCAISKVTGINKEK